MDQSFSVDNFKKILSYENRKGRNLEKEFFPSIFEATKAITEINKKIHTLLRFGVTDEGVLAKLNEEMVSKKNLPAAVGVRKVLSLASPPKMNETKLP